TKLLVKPYLKEKSPGKETDELFGYVRQQSHLTCALDRSRQHSLILCARSGHTSRNDLSIGADETLQQFNILIVDVFNFILREVADLLAAHALFLECHNALLS